MSFTSLPTAAIVERRIDDLRGFSLHRTELLDAIQSANGQLESLKPLYKLASLSLLALELYKISNLDDKSHIEKYTTPAWELLAELLPHPDAYEEPKTIPVLSILAILSNFHHPSGDATKMQYIAQGIVLCSNTLDDDMRPVDDHSDAWTIGSNLLSTATYLTTHTHILCPISQFLEAPNSPERVWTQWNKGDTPLLTLPKSSLNVNFSNVLQEGAGVTEFIAVHKAALQPITETIHAIERSHERYIISWLNEKDATPDLEELCRLALLVDEHINRLTRTIGEWFEGEGYIQHPWGRALLMNLLAQRVSLLGVSAGLFETGRKLAPHWMKKIQMALATGFVNLARDFELLSAISKTLDDLESIMNSLIKGLEYMEPEDLTQLIKSFPPSTKSSLAKWSEKADAYGGVPALKEALK